MERKIKYGLIHCHTENSLKDSTLSPTNLVKRAYELGAPAVTLTDHGTLTGIYEFLRAGEDINSKNPDEPIKCIPGVEAYVREDNDNKKVRRHMLLLAKNYDGYKAICRAVTKSNTRIFDGYPCFNMDIIKECFGEGSVGHGNVIATSACVGGILAQILLENSTLQDAISKLQVKANKYASPNDPVYLKNVAMLEEYQKKAEDLVIQRDELKKIAETKFAKWEKAVSKMTGDERVAAEADLKAKKERCEQAKIDLENTKKELATTRRRETAARQAVRASEKDHSKWYEIQSEIKQLKTGLCNEEQLYEGTQRTTMLFNDIFGTGNFYIELQYHGIPEEAKVMPLLAKIAKELNIPVVACNDVHVANNDPGEVRARALVGALRFNKWMPGRPDDSEYYIKTDEELQSWLSMILDPETVAAAFEGIRTIVNSCNVQFPKDNHYPVFVGGIEGETAAQRLRRLTEEGIQKKYPNGDFPYRERVEYELDIITKMQYTDYLCIVQDYLAYGRALGKDCPEGVGYSIGPGRGSAAGSEVCYLIGITDVDPMKYDLLFERFLNPDRVSSPDIDADFSEEVRGRVLDYVKQKYGTDAVCCITTKGTTAARAAIKAVARVRGSEKFADPNMSNAFYELGNDIAKMIPKEPGAKLATYESELRTAFAGNVDAQEIISDAMLIEGTAINYGMHAAGVIIADNGDVGEYVPLRWNEDKDPAKSQWCCQCDMVEAEKQAGLLKFDFLGLSNLDIITQTLRAIKRNTGKTIEMNQVPQDPRVYQEIFATGRTNFVFQFESDGMKNLLRRFKPESLEHLTMLNALFRPGPLQYADPICDVKAGKKKPAYICAKAKKILATTYGYPIYQEQVMQICNQLAGFTLGEADMVRRYMSKKKEKELAKFKPKFIDGLVNENSVQKDAAERFWDELMDFAKYGFNKSHAVVYAQIAYYTAWLKLYYPTEYMTAVMNVVDIKKLPIMIQECRELGIKVLPPDINRSQNGFTGQNGEILFGLGNIKNVGKGAEDILSDRAEHGLYRSLKELLQRAHPTKTVCESLIDAGAFDCWCDNRAAMKMALPNLQDDLKKIESKNESIDLATKELDCAQGLSEKDTAKLQRKIDNLIQKKNEYQERFNCTTIPVSLPEDKIARLAAENEFLGMYISGHPLQEYPDAINNRGTTIEKALDKNYVTVAGILRDLSIKKRKSDGKPMAFFKLEDETGTAEVCCFTKTFETFGTLLSENEVFLVEGRFNIDEDDDTGITTRKINAEKLKVVQAKPKKIIVFTKDLPTWTEVVYPQLIPFKKENGSEVVVYDTMLGEFRKTTLKLSKNVLQADITGAEITEQNI